MNPDLLAIPAVAAPERIRYGSSPEQFLDLWPAVDAAKGLAIMLHGGFWRARYDLTHASHLCKAIADAGFHVANVEYRRVGNPGGGWPGTYDDVLAATRAAQQHFAHASAVVLGHSAGGHLALRLAADVPT